MIEKKDSFALLILDIATLFFSWFLSYYTRFSIGIPGAQTGLEDIFIRLSIPLVGISIVTFHRHRHYQVAPRKIENFINKTSKLFTSNLQAFFTFVIVLYFFWPDKISRLTLLNYFFISSTLLIFLHSIFESTLLNWRNDQKNKKILLVGEEHDLQLFKNEFKKFNLVHNTQFVGPIAKITIAQLEEIRPHHVVMTYSPNAQDFFPYLEKNLIPIDLILPSALGPLGGYVELFGDIPLISLNQVKLNSWEFRFKRLFDFFSTLIGLIIISPLMFLLMILTKMTSKGPIFYGQERMGLDGKSFQMWKFRSMKVDAEKETGAVWCAEEDPRRTAFGTFLRKSSFDELPQLWNVLKGEMSLVGPRPERPVFVHKFKNEIPHYMLRHKMKAGITGWAQINGLRGNTSLEDRILYDLYYIKNWSLFLDLKILLLTFWKGIFSKNAY